MMNILLLLMITMMTMIAMMTIITMMMITILDPQFVFYCNKRLKSFISDIYLASTFE